MSVIFLLVPFGSASYKSIHIHSEEATAAVPASATRGTGALYLSRECNTAILETTVPLAWMTRHT